MADDKKNIILDDLDNVTGGISIPLGSAVPLNGPESLGSAVPLNGPQSLGSAVPLGSAMVNKNDGSITNNAPMINNGPCINNARLLNKNGTISND